MINLRPRLLVLCLALTLLAAGLAGTDVRVNIARKGGQVETPIAANPLDPLNLVAAWIDLGPMSGGGNVAYGFTPTRPWRPIGTATSISSRFARRGANPRAASDCSDR